MGYRRSAVRRLSFDDPDLAGLEVDAYVPTIAIFQRVAELTPLNLVDVARSDEAAELVSLIGDTLAGWNLEDDDGAPVVCDAEAFATQDKDLVLAVINAWIDAMVGVPAPLPRPSADGSPADGIPMTPMASQAS